ncbi:BZ3500_MvSof-1268-A1-R1_Chr9g10835 [Microbotryum saponariae]|uniref:Ornithine decarboxylase antizyme n=1 Tax=Microbotryum saponariae TaxID=289078 RepID=A0A2X0KAZ0_9BASI|nr:BZ3501_MvSof-1269-A2-R1_Chr9g10583 [Microbotryum saponariae]SDA00778.1 BZ3500_MvSof-1268-A1-R1_Chr9g10835 [Microbotryum saponariae]
MKSHDKLHAAHATTEAAFGLAAKAPFYATLCAQAYVTVPITALKLSTALLSLGSHQPTSTRPRNDSSSSLGTPCSSANSSPPPAYNSIYPTSSSPQSARAPSILSTKSTSTFLNPLQAALNSPSKPIKPLLSPRSSHDSTDSHSLSVNTATRPAARVVDVLSLVFPTSSPAQTLPHSSVDLSEFSSAWKGAVLENPDAGTRTLYVVGGSYQDVNMRESVCGVLEKAEDELACTGVVMCLEKNSPDLGELIHQLLYVGGTITSGPFTANPAYILVGLDV